MREVFAVDEKDCCSYQGFAEQLFECFAALYYTLQTEDRATIAGRVFFMRYITRLYTTGAS